MPDEHLTLEELITSIKYCSGELGGYSCDGCPNLVPGSIGKTGSIGIGKCRFSTTSESLRILEAVRDGRPFE